MSSDGADTTTFSLLRTDLRDGVLTITLDPPSALNAFTVEMGTELVRAFEAASADDEVGAVIVTGAGRAFCAGMDLTAEGNVFGLDEGLRPDMEDMVSRREDPEVQSGVADSGGKVSLAVYACTKPVIAAINGPAVGIGATMTLPMDFRIASRSARIGFVFSRLGIVPEACSTWFLPRLVGVSRALEWCFSGEILTADEARDAGLVRDVVDDDELLDTAHRLARKVSSGKSRVGIALTRQMIYRNSAERSPSAAHSVESLAVFYTSIGDGKEGVQAFLEKREPAFRSSVPEDLPPFYPWQR
ncbi:crotonase/enoyl-CoA hydratase family protein [Dietzia sp. B32]|uniref:crotonase/enoyl-CoA hydratase family protein n=1 Tax=Dietzia sp. B32 TaxID=2915130 RepID=UPI0021ADC05B|nr:crotonase/enoyl-CoA hydratase family protein [Dietzia sp. B32]UVE94203.1 crotonase/enoyl-CoA hydratase family protein [Dietzia sp. B32]